MATLTREAWLNEAADLILFEVLGPVTGAGSLESYKIKISVGFSRTHKSNSRLVLGTCFAKAASSDGYSEIFISPIADDSMQILATLAHELIHAIDDCKSGHKGFFAKTARAIGLEGALTATVAGIKLKAKLAEYVELLGPIPHSKINLADQKKQANRNILVSCNCGFRFRTAQAQIDKVMGLHGGIMCPCCGFFMDSSAENEPSALAS